MARKRKSKSKKSSTNSSFGFGTFVQSSDKKSIGTGTLG
jgi:hypothetical protein